MPSTEEINRTIHDAIEKCHASETPLDCLAEEIGKLGGRYDWTIAEIDAVTQKALQMLAILLGPPVQQPEQMPVHGLKLHRG